MTKYYPLQELSEISLVGQSRLHPIEAISRDLFGEFEATFDPEGQLDLAQPVTGYIEVLVEDLKSMNPLYDREVRKRLNIRRFPKIKAEVVAISQQIDANRYLAVGDIAFNGTMHRVEHELSIRQLSGGRLEIDGRVDIDVRDFKVEPPNLFMVGIMPTVEVKLRLVLKQEGEE